MAGELVKNSLRAVKRRFIARRDGHRAVAESDRVSLEKGARRADRRLAAAFWCRMRSDRAILTARSRVAAVRQRHIHA
jgi:hypothetical protein